MRSPGLPGSDRFEMTSTAAPTIDDRIAATILQQIEILEAHAHCPEWSPDFLREHAMMIVQMAEAAAFRGEGHAALF